MEEKKHREAPVFYFVIMVAGCFFFLFSMIKYFDALDLEGWLNHKLGFVVGAVAIIVYGVYGVQRHMAEEEEEKNGKPRQD